MRFRFGMFAVVAPVIERLMAHMTVGARKRTQMGSMGVHSAGRQRGDTLIAPPMTTQTLVHRRRIPRLNGLVASGARQSRPEMHARHKRGIIGNDLLDSLDRNRSTSWSGIDAVGG